MEPSSEESKIAMNIEKERFTSELSQYETHLMPCFNHALIRLKVSGQMFPFTSSLKKPSG